MQLSLALPVLPLAINNPLMASKDRSDADKLEAAKKLRNKALRLLTTRERRAAGGGLIEGLARRGDGEVPLGQLAQ